MPTYNFDELCAAMKNRKTVSLMERHTGKTFLGFVNGIVAEDGGGKNFIVHLHSGKRIFVVTN